MRKRSDHERQTAMGKFASGCEEGKWRMTSGVFLFKVILRLRLSKNSVGAKYHQTATVHCVPEKYHTCDDPKEGVVCL